MIVSRVRAGAVQKDLAAEYGVSEGLISRVVKQSAGADGTAPSPADLSDRTSEQLHNRYAQASRELLECSHELYARGNEAGSLRRRIAEEGAKPELSRDPDWLVAQQKRLAWCEDTKRIGYEMARLHWELGSIVHALVKRGERILWRDVAEKALTAGVVNDGTT